MWKDDGIKIIKEIMEEQEERNGMGRTGWKEENEKSRIRKRGWEEQDEKNRMRKTGWEEQDEYIFRMRRTGWVYNQDEKNGMSI